jgi:hypothetical protein
MHGVAETLIPATVKFSDTWCPASCHPQGSPAAPGSPKMRKQYRSGSNRCARSGADASMSARRTCSIAMTETTVA